MFFWGIKAGAQGSNHITSVTHLCVGLTKFPENEHTIFAQESGLQKVKQSLIKGRVGRNRSIKPLGEEAIYGWNFS
jgi:hypothetical protein